MHILEDFSSEGYFVCVGLLLRLLKKPLGLSVLMAFGVFEVTWGRMLMVVISPGKEAALQVGVEWCRRSPSLMTDGFLFDI